MPRQSHHQARYNPNSHQTCNRNSRLPICRHTTISPPLPLPSTVIDSTTIRRREVLCRANAILLADWVILPVKLQPPESRLVLRDVINRHAPAFTTVPDQLSRQHPYLAERKTTLWNILGKCADSYHLVSQIPSPERNKRETYFQDGQSQYLSQRLYHRPRNQG